MIQAEDERDSAVREDDQSAQIMTVLRPGDTEARFRLDLAAGVVVQRSGDGGFNLLNPSAATSEGFSVGHLDAPWAVDADGKRLPTDMTLEGDQLVQRVVATGAAYPITVDPHYTWGLVSGTVYFNKGETKAIALGATVVSWLPSPWTVIGGRAVSVWAAIAAAKDECVKVRVGLSLNVVGFGYYSGRTGDGYCR